MNTVNMDVYNSFNNIEEQFEKKYFLLIDNKRYEYDVLLENSFFRGFYDEKIYYKT